MFAAVLTMVHPKNPSFPSPELVSGESMDDLALGSPIHINSSMSLAEFLRRTNLPQRPSSEWYGHAFCSSSRDVPPAKGTVILSHEVYGRVEQHRPDLGLILETTFDTETMALLAILYRMEQRPVQRAALYREALRYGFPPLTLTMFEETIMVEQESKRWKVRFDQFGVLGEIEVLRIGSFHDAATQSGNHGHAAVTYDVNIPVLDEVYIRKTIFDGCVEDFARYFPIISVLPKKI